MKLKKFDSQTLLWRAMLALWALGIIIPLGWIILVSLKTNQEFFQSAWNLPETPQFVNYINAWKNMNLGRSFLNTIYYVGMSLIIKLLFALTTAYSMTRIKFKGRKFLSWLILISLYLPGINAMVPTYVMMKDLHMLNSLNGLIIFSSAGIDAFAVMVLGGFLSSIPHEMEESAYIDGANYMQTLFHIILPMARPGMVTILIFSFLGLYNNFLWPFIMLEDTAKYPIAVKVYEINKKMHYMANWVGLCACVVISLIPSLLIYVVMQKRIKSGLNVGALKG